MANTPLAGTIKSYYYLTKPGIIYGNVLTAAAGFLLASKGSPKPGLFIAAILGLALVIASACVFNNYIDRHIDAAMTRTKRRALVTGAISGRNALVFGAILLLCGSVLLIAYTNPLVVALAAIGFADYVVLYGIAKRKSALSTLIGSISGAMPIVGGYCAAAGVFDTGALLVFLLMVIWQMPHFYAIAIYRRQDYAAAKVPVLSIRSGAKTTKVHIAIYIAAYALIAPALTILGYAGLTYLIIMTTLSLTWLHQAIQGFTTKDDVAWARKLFGFSLIILLGFSALISASAYLP